MDDVHIGDAAFFVIDELGERKRLAGMNLIVHGDLLFCDDFSINHAAWTVNAAERSAGHNEQPARRERDSVRVVAEQKDGAPFGAEVKGRRIIPLAADIRAGAEREPRNAALFAELRIAGDGHAVPDGAHLGDGERIWHIEPRFTELCLGCSDYTGFDAHMLLAKQRKKRLETFQTKDYNLHVW